jgi:hypothetical protein
MQQAACIRLREVAAGAVRSELAVEFLEDGGAAALAVSFATDSLLEEAGFEPSVPESPRLRSPATEAGRIKLMTLTAAIVVSRAAGNGGRSENGDYIYGKRRLREMDRRIRFLSKRAESAEVVDPN